MQKELNWTHDEHICIALIAAKFVEDSLDRKLRYTDIDGDISEDLLDGYSIEEYHKDYYGNDTAMYCYYGSPEVISYATDDMTFISENETGSVKFRVLATRENIFVLESEGIPSGAGLGCALLRF